MSVMSPARVGPMPAVSARNIKDIPTVVRKYPDYAVPHFHSLNTWGLRTLAALVFLATPAVFPKLFYTALAFFAVSKFVSLRAEARYINGEVVPSINIKAVEDPAAALDKVRKALPVLKPAVRERLVNKLEKKGFSILDIPLAAARLARKGLGHFWSLGSGLSFWLTSSVAVCAFYMHRHIAGMLGGVDDYVASEHLPGAVKAIILFTFFLLLPISKVIGILGQRSSLNKLFSQVKTDEDKAALRQSVKEQNLAPRVMKRVIQRYEQTFKERWS